MWPLGVKKAGEAIGSSVRVGETCGNESKKCRDKLRPTCAGGSGGYDV